jgi:hypothetical protein
MCRPKAPKVERSAPPPIAVPEQTDSEVVRRRNRDRQRMANAMTRTSTASAAGAPGPTSQMKTLLGS